MSTPQIRELADADLPFLRQMLETAVFWRADRERGTARLLGAVKRALLRLLFRGYLNQYHEGWGRAGDVGFVAWLDGRRVGAVWYRLFTETRHGDGFIDERTPELAIAVAAAYRGRDVGRALMQRIHDEARARGLARIALSVEPENPAKRLYASLGYVDHQPGDSKGRMVLDLSRAG